MANDSIIRRIQKLLELANTNNNDQEAEASSAMAKVQELLAQHNLDLAIVKDTAVAGGVKQVEEKREKTKVNRSAMYEWQRELWRTIAEANFCFHWVSNERTGKLSRNGDPVYIKRHTVLGRESNVIAVQMMGEYLCDTIERVLPYANVDRLSRSAISWRKGCAERLMARIQETTEAMKQTVADAPAGALVLADVFERERAGNYDAQYGEGAWAKRQARYAEWDRESAERQQEEAQRAAAEQQAWNEMLASETDEQRTKREAKETKAKAAQQAKDDKENARYYRRQRKESSKVDWSAFRSGKAAGDEINLSKQVKETTTKRVS